MSLHLRLNTISETGWFALAIVAALAVFLVLIFGAAATDGHAVSYVFAAAAPLAALGTVAAVASYGFRLLDQRRRR